jgi:TorA maturation chaperone TorD
MPNNYDAEFLALTKNRRETYALFARLFRQEISPELLRQLRKMREGFHDPEAAGKGQVILDRYLSGTEPLQANQVIAELAADYAGLFLNAGSRPAYPYESVYTSPEQLLMQEGRDKVRQMYAAAGLNRSGECREPEDHVAVEMEFMNHLCFRTAAAIEEGNGEMVRAHLQSQREFLGNHLLLWAPRFCRDLMRNATTDFYRALGYLVRDFLELERDLIAEWGAD